VGQTVAGLLGMHSVEEELVHTQSKLAEALGEIERLSSKCKQLEEEARCRQFSYENLKEDPKSFKFYTGLSVDSFADLLTIMGGSVHTMCYTQPEADNQITKAA